MSDCVEIDPFLVADAIRGTVVRHPVLERCYWVKGSKCVYRVTAWLHEGSVIGNCACKGFQHRRSCLHLSQVAAYIRREALCPACEGKGWLHDRPGERWATPGPIMLACCLGTGLRSEWERMGRLVRPGQFRDTYCPAPVALVDALGRVSIRPVTTAVPRRSPDEEARLRAIFA